MQSNNAALLSLLAFSLLTLTACGGGGSSSTDSDNETTDNQSQVITDSSGDNNTGEQAGEQVPTPPATPGQDTAAENLSAEELAALFQPPPAPGSNVATVQFDGLWDANNTDADTATQSETRYWLISSNDNTWTTYLLDPNTNDENCFVVSSTSFNDQGLGRLEFPEAQPESIDAMDNIVTVSVSAGVMSLTYQDQSSTSVITSHSAVTALSVQDLQICS